jgi:hypothetical protein
MTFTLKINATFAKTEKLSFHMAYYWKPKLYIKFQQRKLRTKLIKMCGGKFANCFVMFLVQENPFQRAARRQQRSGSSSSSSTAGDNSDSTSSNTTACSDTASQSNSQQQHNAIDMRGICCFLFKLIVFH